MKVHDVKSGQPHFDDVCAGRKAAELRLDDRDYQVGDVLRQHEYVGEMTGRFIAHKITHKLTGGPWLADGYCMLSLAREPLEEKLGCIGCHRELAPHQTVDGPMCSVCLGSAMDV